MKLVCEDAPAKINLSLHVTGKRPDSYHLLESLVVFTRFGDRVTVEMAQADRVEIDGPFGNGLPVDGGNLIVRARDALLTSLDDPQRRVPYVSIHLEKNLPIASGIGGGSSDAAATLKALNKAWQLGLSHFKLADIGVTLGADVPMCIDASPLIARGIGEQIEPVLRMPELAMVLVNPGVAVSTPEIFHRLATSANPPLPPLSPPLNFQALVEWLKTTRNDLQPVAIGIAPQIATALAELQTEQSAFARMSGSGATCFGLFARQEDANAAALAIGKRRPDWFVVATSTLP